MSRHQASTSAPRSVPPAPRSIAMSTLEVHDLEVEAGGKTVVERLSFTLRAGDKVGVVGRNGAGKTSTLKVLAGEAPAAGGSAIHRGALGYLRQDPAPASRGRPDQGAGVHPRRARSRRDGPPRGEGPHRARGIPRRPQRRPVRPARGGVPATPAAIRPSPRPERSRPGSGSRTTAWPCPWERSPAGSDAGSSSPASSSADRTCLMLDEPTNHLDADAKFWLMKFLASYKGALMVVSHDIGLLDASITRILHLDRDGVVEYKRHVLAVPRGPPSGRGASHGARFAPGAGDPPAEDPRRLDARPDGQAGAQGEDARHAGRQARERKVDGPTKERKVRFRFPEPPHCGKTVLTTEGLAKGYGGPPVFDRRHVRGRARRAPPDHGTERRRQDQPAADPDASRRTPTRARSGSGTAWSRATTRRSTKASPTGSTCWPTCAPRRRPTTRRCDRCWACSACRGDGVPGRRHPLRGREDQARPRPAGGGTQEPAPARRADEQPRSALPHGHRRGAPGLARRDGDREPRHRSSSKRLRPNGSC